MQLTVLLTLAALSCAHALFLCPPNACATVRCAAVTDANCNGRIAKNGGFCGCCDTCVTQINEGENCRVTLLLGSPVKSECADGLFCHRESTKCVKKTCAMHRSETQARLDAARAAGAPLLGAELLRCDKDGSYSPKQCSGSQCYCVSATGEQIQNFGANRWEADDMDCKCARDQHEYQEKGLIGKMFRCNAQGSYSDVQCAGSVCFCTDGNGKQLLSMSAIHISQQQKLDCKKALCAKQYTTIQARLDNSSTPILGLEKPDCAEDGSFRSKQCTGSQCMCVDEEGASIKSYSANRWEADNMDCNCARDEQRFEKTGLLGRSFSCDTRGSYNAKQCVGSSCYCVDVGGQRLTAKPFVHISQINSLKC